jgi:hypothetical protein
VQQRYLIFSAAAALLLAACGSGQPTTSTTASTAATPPPSRAVVAAKATGAAGAGGAAAVVPSVNPSAPPEITLATLQKKASVDAKDPLVQQFAQQLDALSKKCPDLSRQELATDVETINQGIESGGVHETLLQTITGVNKAIPASNQGSCPKAFADYATARMKNP